MAISGRAHGNQVFTSFIGTKILGVVALGNQKGGVLLTGHAHANVIGAFGRKPANLISGNTGIGVHAAGRDDPEPGRSTTTSASAAAAIGCRTPAARS